MIDRKILWDFHNELKEQQSSGRSAREGNAEIFAKTISALQSYHREKIKKVGIEKIILKHSGKVEEIPDFGNLPEDKLCSVVLNSVTQAILKAIDKEIGK